MDFRVLNKVNKITTPLTCREKEVLTKIIIGLTNSEIATQLFLSEKTIKFHCTNIYRKLGIKGRRSLYYSVSKDSVLMEEI